MSDMQIQIHKNTYTQIHIFEKVMVRTVHQKQCFQVFVVQIINNNNSQLYFQMFHVSK